MKAVILAGGKSSRMGQDKALMTLGEKRVIQYILETLSSVFEEVYISGFHSRYQFLSNPVIEDEINEKGPMGGIYSALKYCEEDIFVCSCDMPFVSKKLIEKILKKRDKEKISVVKYREKIYPVLGIYPYSVVEELRKSIDKEQLRMTSLLEDLEAHYINEDEESEEVFLNINTPENFKKAEIIVNKFL